MYLFSVFLTVLREKPREEEELYTSLREEDRSKEKREEREEKEKKSASHWESALL